MDKGTKFITEAIEYQTVHKTTSLFTAPDEFQLFFNLILDYEFNYEQLPCKLSKPCWTSQ